MDVQTFRSTLTAFADSPAEVDLSRGRLLVQVRDELLEATLTNRSGALFVVEADNEYLAEQWLIKRIARLPLLADRILAHTTPERYFVTPSGLLLDQLDESPLDEEHRVEDAGKTVLQILSRRAAGVASVIYLTSDAGEGKTTLISHLARTQAELYRAKERDWLLVPVSLGGRTFLRFDDVIVGALVNRFRFPMLYYEAFIELVKMGAVVPAFDGFEEMFVEGAAGDAISALGTLVNTLKSSGTLLIAARKAYFEYKSLQAQTRLFDSLGNQSVCFARLALERWKHSQFIEYAQKRDVPNAQEIYDDVASKLGEDHPLLTRAVLVSRLLDVATEVGGRTDLLRRIESDPNDYFRQFVGAIISREAREKWLDKKGELAQPLISEAEHYELLSSVALEMWSNATESLRGDVLGFVAEVFADSKRKDKVVSYQIIERLKQHALLVQAEGNQFAFDHQEFYYFFLGEALGAMFVASDKPGIRHAFRHAMLPALSVDVAVRYAIRNGVSAEAVVEIVNEICAGEPRTSFVSENLGGIVSRLLDYAKSGHVIVRHASFPPQSLIGRRYRDVEFEDCYFQNTSLAGTALARCRFNRCEFEGLALASDTVLDDVVLHDSNCRSVTPRNSETAVFDPRQVMLILEQAGFRVTSTERRPIEQAFTIDNEIVLIQRMLRAFMRSTGVNESIFQKRLGAQASFFFRELLPILLDARIVEEEPYRGSGHQRRFRLGVPLEVIKRAMEACNGRFDRFMRELAGEHVRA